MREPRWIVSLIATFAACAGTNAQGNSTITELGDAIRERGDAEAVLALDRLLKAAEPTASLARREQKAILATACDQLEALAAMEPGPTQALAAAEVARLRARDAKWPVADVRRIEIWHQGKLAELEKAIAQDRQWNKERPSRTYGWRIKATTERLRQLRAMNLRAAGLHLLGEFYDASHQTAAAARAVMAHKDLAAAASHLPSIRVETRHGRVDGAGEMMEESREESEIDVAGWASAFFGMASAQSAVDAKRSRELAAANRSVLQRLSEGTLEALRKAYAARLAAEAKALAKRQEETRRQNQRRRR